MEFLLGILFWWPTLVGVLIVAALVEHNEAHGWTAILTLVTGVILWGMFSPSWTTTWMIIAAFIPVGLIWSYWRWRRHCSKVVRLVQDNNLTKSNAVNKLDPKRYTTVIVYWIIAWPFSALEAIVGDIIDVLHVLVRTWFKNMYARVSANAMKELDKIEDEK